MSFRLLRDVPYGTATRAVMDAYLPDGPAEGDRPAAVLLHGGGFVSGDKSNMGGVARFFASSGYVAFALNYRLVPLGMSLALPRDEYWAAVDDVRRGIDFVAAAAERYGIDPARIATFGASAGGNLAAMVGWNPAAAPGAASVAAVVSWSGPLNLLTVATRSPSVLATVTPYLSSEQYRDAVAVNREALLEASPVTYLRADAPPSFIANGRSEVVPVEVATEADALLTELAVPHETMLLAYGHALGYASRARRATLAFLDRHLRGLEEPMAASAEGATR